MPRLPQTPNAVWSDGIHFVRRASDADGHVMRWVVGAHKATASTFKRHAPDRGRGEDIARAATKAWLRDHADDAVHIKVSTPPEASAKVELPKFSITDFDCICANPYAQVWQCRTKDVNTIAKPIGRRRRDGSSPLQARYRHTAGTCAVLIGPEPVRDPDGQVTVFPTWQHAEEEALNLYHNADEEDVIRWQEGDYVVYATGKIEVHFSPESYGTKKPFVLYLVDHNRPVYIDSTRPTMYADDPTTRANAETNPQAYLDHKDKNAERRSLDRQPAFEETPVRFRSIWQAIEEAYRREKMLRGETVR